MVSDSPNGATKWHCGDTVLRDQLDNIGTKECQSYRDRIFSNHPYIADSLANQYVRIAQNKDYAEANLFIGRIDKELHLHDLNLSCSSTEVKNFCEDKSRQCQLLIAEYGPNEFSYNACRSLAVKYKITIPRTDIQKSIKPMLNKLSCPKWWFRQISKLRLRHVEQVHRKLNLVNNVSGSYASNFSCEHRKTQLKNSFEYLMSNEIVNQNGQTYTLLELYKKSIACPRIRKAELMTRIRGFEEVARELGHAGELYTLTSPSKMHAVNFGGIPNPKYQGATPKEVNDYFNNLWKLIRSALHKKNIHPYGFRVVEPHHDGTPHWHLLLFMHPNDVKTTRQVIRKYLYREDPNEQGAKSHRFDAKSIDPNIGTAAGYIAKYIAKNIDGEGIDTDLFGCDSKIAASRIDAWSSTWDLRQFQQIGGPSVTVWRELRRLKESNDTNIKKALSAADSGDWAAYVLAMGGPSLPRRNRPIRPAYEIKSNEKIDTNTGEIIQDNYTRYGDLKSPSVIGVYCKNKLSRTRTNVWTILMEPMTTCGPQPEGSMLELATRMLGRDPREREGPEASLGLV